MPLNKSHASTLGWTLPLVAVSIALYMLSSIAIFARTFILPVFGPQVANTEAQISPSNISTTVWHAPNQTPVNDLKTVIDGTGVNGFIFNNSDGPPGNEYYGGYNWCNMPHVKTQTYKKAPAGYVLEYVEVVGFNWARSTTES